MVWRALRKLARKANRRTVLVAVVLLCLFVAIGYVFGRYNPEARLEWYSTLLGTIFGVGLTALFGVWLFSFQSEESDEDRRRKFMTALAGEAQAIVNILEQEPTPVPGVSAEDTAKSVFVPLPLTIATEAARSALFDADDMLFLSKQIAKLQVNNNEVFFILASRALSIQPEYRRLMDQWLKERQNIIIEESRTFLAHLESEEGIKPPNAGT